MKKILVLIKTKLSEDTRVLNQISLLAENFEESCITVVNFPNEGDITDLNLPSNVSLITIKSPFRGIKVLRPINAMIFWLTCLLIAIKVRPNIIHCHDNATAPLAVIMSFLIKRSYIVYDDHELPNSYPKKSIGIKIEELALKKADVVLFANSMRRSFLKHEMDIHTKYSFIFDNLCPYHSITPFSEQSVLSFENLANVLASARQKYKGVFLHQGVVNEARRSDLLYTAIGKLNDYFFVILSPGSKEEVRLNVHENVLVLSPIPSMYLGNVWSLVDYSLIFYDSMTLNNNLCAPNRFYLSFKYSKPFIFNDDNKSLSFLSEFYGGGVAVDGFEDIETVKSKLELSTFKCDYNDSVETQKENFISIYGSLFKDKTRL
ncbi:hypothetical protein CWE13_04905 [Aliidiomarina shirensis]|uniref:Glycosyltransferase subfamily 4-like N-terminal domain-containing protein n=1 Tax=Aliidiomarina shirensis TaxID=1048642 RepID=A0A432WU54_9GAMM|nr:hypothetical protein [Aliidiomarina shirensis]RUO37306.1 hypothetical protein CWE13_04905 [Aliidiomarina shirensis]